MISGIKSFVVTCVVFVVWAWCTLHVRYNVVQKLPNQTTEGELPAYLAWVMSPLLGLLLPAMVILVGFVFWIVFDTVREYFEPNEDEE